MNPEDNFTRVAISIELARHAARKNGFYWFIDKIFRYSFFPREPFVTGEYIKHVAERYELYKCTIDVTGRGHFKSTRVHAEIAYNIFIDDGFGFEAQYFSYSETMAKYQLKKLKDEIKMNPFFATVTDLKPQAESVLAYRWEGSNHSMTVEPRGLLGSARGVHAPYLYVDDPLKTEDNSPGAPPDPVSIRKINDIMRSDIIPMLKPGGTCRVVATPQTPYDFFYDKEGMGSRFDISITPSIIDEVNKITQWPELWPYDRIMQEKKTINDDDKFNREYMAQPASTSKSYIKKDQLLKVSRGVGLEFEPHPELEDKEVVAGFDIGKVRHPSHLAIFTKEWLEDNDDGTEVYMYRQIYDEWMDNWEYTDQVEHLNLACEFFNISRLNYDDTRGEFSSFDEQNKLDKAFQPVSLAGAKKKTSIAAGLGDLVKKELITIVNLRRTRNHILLVDGNLNAMEILKGPERGHADSFWSCALAVWTGQVKIPRIYNMYDDSPEPDDTAVRDVEDPIPERNTWASAAPTNGYEENRYFI